jgi:hypothetical protein
MSSSSSSSFTMHHLALRTSCAVSAHRSAVVAHAFGAFFINTHLLLTHCISFFTHSHTHHLAQHPHGLSSAFCPPTHTYAFPSACTEDLLPSSLFSTDFRHPPAAADWSCCSALSQQQGGLSSCGKRSAAGGAALGAPWRLWARALSGLWPPHCLGGPRYATLDPQPCSAVCLLCHLL